MALFSICIILALMAVAYFSGGFYIDTEGELNEY